MPNLNHLNPNMNTHWCFYVITDSNAVLKFYSIAVKWGILWLTDMQPRSFYYSNSWLWHSQSRFVWQLNALFRQGAWASRPRVLTWHRKLLSRWTGSSRTQHSTNSFPRLTSSYHSYQGRLMSHVYSQTRPVGFVFLESCVVGAVICTRSNQMCFWHGSEVGDLRSIEGPAPY